jgi:hypothetical protein
MQNPIPSELPSPSNLEIKKVLTIKILQLLWSIQTFMVIQVRQKHKIQLTDKSINNERKCIEST